MKGFLLDTNVPSELTYPRPKQQVERWLDETDDEQLFFSVISLAEICKGIAKLPESKKRVQLQGWLNSTLRPWFAGRILPITEVIAERMGRWAGEGEAKGLTIKIADGLIAATAIEHDLTVVTRNVKDFVRFSVPIFNPWE
ncbi:MAG: type II toxin-antitoxin system VapC family toxin [Bryobacteraceae bacterium]